jgi:hypothetical protein
MNIPNLPNLPDLTPIQAHPERLVAAPPRPSAPLPPSDPLRRLITQGKLGELQLGRCRLDIYAWGALKQDPAYPAKR